jgi:hypothetical protein
MSATPRTDNAIIVLLVVLIVAIVVGAAIGAIDMDDTKSVNTLAPASYQHPKEEP